MNSMKPLLVMPMAVVASALTGAEIDGNEWQDQTRLSLGKEAPRTAFFTYPDDETARKSFWDEAKPWKTGDEVPFSAISLDYDISGWEGIVVPCSWQAIHARGKLIRWGQSPRHSLEES